MSTARHRRFFTPPNLRTGSAVELLLEGWCRTKALTGLLPISPDLARIPSPQERDPALAQDAVVEYHLGRLVRHARTHVEW